MIIQIAVGAIDTPACPRHGRGKIVEEGVKCKVLVKVRKSQQEGTHRPVRTDH